jgi:poly-gamma-glutamate capsule biosynthesis protein CapA/YwtB (metallophosphatase superfamily)
LIKVSSSYILRIVMGIKRFEGLTAPITRRSAAVIAFLALVICALFLQAGCGEKDKAGSRVEMGDVPAKLVEAMEESDMVTVAAGGDVNFGDGVTPTLTANGLGYPFEDVAYIFESADLGFVNLECAISSGGSPVPGKEFCFRGPSDSAAALTDGGVDIVSLANNHSKDYGTGAFLDTLAHLKESGVAWCGAGNNAAEAYAPTIMEVRGKKIAFVAFTWVIPDGWPATESNPGCATTTDPDRVAATIRDADSKADYVVASFHWGIELATAPNEAQRRLARLSVDNGADLVLGHHPHVVQGFELYKNRLIAYSLGNYVFSPPREISSKTLTLVTLLNPDGLVQAKVVPNVISGCHPVVLTGDPAASWLGTVAGYSKGLGTTMNISGSLGFINGASGKPGAE